MHVLTPILETIETIIDSFSNDNSDGTKNIKEAIGLLTKTTTWHVHQAFFCAFPCHYYMSIWFEMPKIKFYGEHKQASKALKCLLFLKQ